MNKILFYQISLKTLEFLKNEQIWANESFEPKTNKA